MTNPTSNYNFQMPTATDLVTDLPADFEVFGQAVDTRLKALQPGTTLGDLAYSSATANTNTRLGIGSTGQVLTVAAGVPSWASAATAADSYELINSGGTALTGAATITVSSISGKNNLYVKIIGASSNAINSTFTIRLNADSGANYDMVTYSFNSGPLTNFGSSVVGASQFNCSYMDGTSDTFSAHIRVEGTAGTGVKPYRGMSFGSANGTTNRNVSGVYNGTSAISSVSIISDAGNFDAGTIYVYGA